MIVDLKTGENRQLCPCRVFDANGLEWKRVVRCDTETGELTIAAVDRDGRGIFDGQHRRTVSIRAAAPLHLEPILAIDRA